MCGFKLVETVFRRAGGATYYVVHTLTMPSLVLPPRAMIEQPLICLCVRQTAAGFPLTVSTSED
jgi:hypothetical protein